MLSEEFILKTRNQLLEELAYEIHDLREFIKTANLSPENGDFLTIWFKQQRIRKLKNQIHELNWILGIESDFERKPDKFALVKIGEKA
jgi:hypothetical protein